MMQIRSTVRMMRKGKKKKKKESASWGGRRRYLSKCRKSMTVMNYAAGGYVLLTSILF